MYPALLSPTGIESFNVNGQTVGIPECVVTFARWTGEPIKETFGGKPLVAVDNTPMFAELAIMTHFAEDGWDARWVETYGKRKPIYMTEWADDKYRNQVHRPFGSDHVDDLLHDIAKLNGNSWAGCWDVVAYKDDRVVFAESKRMGRDSIRSSQTNWLGAGLRYGLQPNNFLVVQWDM